MKLLGISLMFVTILFSSYARSQLLQPANSFTHDDTLRGSITECRKGWDVIKYDLTVKPDIVGKTIEGKNTITYFESLAVHTMQIDLQQPLVADSILDDGGRRYEFRRVNNVCFVRIRDSLATYKISPGIRN